LHPATWLLKENVTNELMTFDRKIMRKKKKKKMMMMMMMMMMMIV